MGKIIRNGVEFSGTLDNAANVNYNNELSGMEATTVQEAIDEVNESLNYIGKKEYGYEVIGDNPMIIPEINSYVDICKITLPKGRWLIYGGANISMSSYDTVPALYQQICYEKDGKRVGIMNDCIRTYQRLTYTCAYLEFNEETMDFYLQAASSITNTSVYARVMYAIRLN